MGSGSVSSVAMGVAVILAVAVMAPGAVAQGTGTGTVPSCAQKLIQCSSYLATTTTPPDTCCNPIREAVRNELPCLCSLLTSKDLISAFQINVTQALDIPKRCGVTSDTSLCNSVSSTNTTSSAGAPSAPPATPGGDKNAAVGVRMGASGLVVLLAFWWSIVA